MKKKNSFIVPKAIQLDSGNWFIRLRLKDEYGVQHSFPITKETEEECRAEAIAIKYGLKEVPRKKGTLRIAIEDYINHNRAILSPSTIRAYTSYKANRFQKYMDRDITSVDWQKAIDEEDCSPKTLKNVWSLARAAMAEKGFTPTVRLPKVVKTPMQWLTPEQIPVFLDAIHGKDGELPALLGLHSLRRSEMFALDWANVDLKNKIIKVRGALVLAEGSQPVKKATNKTTNSRRDIPIMIPRLLELFEETEVKEGPVLTCNIATPYDQINAVCRENDLPEVGLHGLRRSFASLGHSIGMSEDEIMSIGGWDDFQTLHKFYVYLSDQDRKRAANKMASFYNNANEKCQ